MHTTIFQLVGGPWDGQTLSTNAEEEANAVFAKALLAMTHARVGSRIPLISPACQERINAGIGARERGAMKPHAYEIIKAVQCDQTLRVMLKHRAAK